MEQDCSDEDMKTPEGAVGGTDVNPSRDVMPTQPQKDEFAMCAPHRTSLETAEVHMNDGVINMANKMSTTHNLYYHKPSFTKVVNTTNIPTEDISGYAQIKDQSNAEIHTDTELFTPTSGYQQAIDMLEDTGLLIIIGPAGSGKTMLARALLRHFQNQGRTPLVLHRYEDFRQHVGGDRKQVIMIDDAFGTEEFTNSGFMIWLRAFTTFRAFARQKKCFSVITCSREVVAGLEMKYNRGEIFENFKILDMETLTSFTDAEKKELLTKHMAVYRKQLHRSVFKDILAIDSSQHMFPKRCKEFSQRTDSDAVLHNIFKADETCQGEDQTVTCDTEKLTDQLMNAIQAADADLVRDLLQRGASAESEDYYGNIPLHVASKSGFDCVVRILLASGSNIDAADVCNQMTALHYASSCGHHVVIQILLKKGAKIDEVDREGWTPLHFACSKGYADITETLLQNKAEVNKPNQSGQTALHLASAAGQVDVVNILLDSAADVNIKDRDGESALHTACKYGHINIAKCLASREANKESKDGRKPFDTANKEGQDLVNARNNEGWTPLLITSYYGFAELVTMLIRHGADINAQDNKGKTPLSYASSEGHEDVAMILMEHGANLELADTFCRMPLHRACSNGHTTVAAAVLDHFAQINTGNNNGHTNISLEEGNVETAHVSDRKVTATTEAENSGEHQLHNKRQVPDRHTLSQVSVYIDARDNRGRSSLYLACGNNNLSTAKLLVARGANKEANDMCGNTPLHEACLKGYTDIITFLLDQGVNVAAADRDSSTTLHLACRWDRPAAASILLQNEAPVNVSDNRGWTPLLLACYYGFEELVSMLICHGADVNAQDNKGRTPLCHASSKGHKGVAMRLIKHGADLELASKDAWTPLQRACAYAHATIAAALLDHGAQINRRNKSGTALHLACRHGHVETAYMLISRGADMNARDGDGYTPSEVANRYCHSKVVEMLAETNQSICQLS